MELNVRKKLGNFGLSNGKIKLLRVLSEKSWKRRIKDGYVVINGWKGRLISLCIWSGKFLVDSVKIPGTFEI
jgi:hypothetical protein